MQCVSDKPVLDVLHVELERVFGLPGLLPEELEVAHLERPVGPSERRQYCLGGLEAVGRRKGHDHGNPEMDNCWLDFGLRE